jgi:hypothetical protein
MLKNLPLASWFSGDIIGNEVPRDENGEFDWSKASFYWKVVWWLDWNLGIFGGDIWRAEKED